MSVYAMATLALLFSIPSVEAFQLEDHRAITRQAFAEFATCFPKVAAGLDVESLVQADVDEDLNLVVKELMYSHYYNPRKQLQMWRGSSRDRIEGLSPPLRQCRQSGAASADDIATLGHVIHHYQDMAVPAHVVPVNHSFWDGFENWVVTAPVPSGLTCDQIQKLADPDLEAILNDTAQSTLAAIAAWRVEAITADGKGLQTLSGADFWQTSDDNSFGVYGRLGNAFGTSLIDVEGQGSVIVPDQAYQAFKTQQLQLAVKATLRGLVWTIGAQNQ